MCEMDIDGRRFQVGSLAELQARWPSILSKELGSVWFNPEGGGPSLTILKRGEIGWLMYLRGPGDAGFSSRNPAYAGDPDARLEFQIENGQVDSYPIAWTYPIVDALRAAEHFFVTGERAPWIDWHED